MASNKELGLLGETLVAQYLEQRGFSILAKNYRTPVGEIDIIAERGILVTFVEVKTRKTSYFPISDVVTLKKQRKIAKTAELFLVRNQTAGGFDRAYRFDVATVLYTGDVKDSFSSQYKIEYIENAFFAQNASSF